MYSLMNGDTHRCKPSPPSKSQLSHSHYRSWLKIGPRTLISRTHSISHVKILLGIRKRLQHAHIILLYLLWNLGPKVLPTLQKRQDRGNAQIGDGRFVAETKVRIFKIHIHQRGEIFIHQLGELFLGLVVLGGETEDSVGDGGEGGVKSGLSPVHDHVDLATQNGIGGGGIEGLAVFVVHAKESHNGTAFPDGAVFAIEFKGGAGVAGIHGDEFGSASLAVGVDDFGL